MMASGTATDDFGHDTHAETVAARYAPRARGLHVLVTGGNTGIGLETARVLALHGAVVTIAARSPQKGLAAVDKIKNAHPDAAVSFMRLDLSSLTAVDAFADAFIASGRDLNILINNAGVMACPYLTTDDGYESQFAVNHLAHFHLTIRLLDVLVRSAQKPGASPSRVVAVSSLANILFAPSEGILFSHLADGPQTYRAWTRYGESKLANILFAYELNRRLHATNKSVIAVSLHPGNIFETELTRHTGFTSGLAAVAQMNLTKVLDVISDGTKSIPQGAATTVVCALDPDVRPGEFYADCRVSDKRHWLAFDDSLATRLWGVSESLVKSALDRSKGEN